MVEGGGLGVFTPDEIGPMSVQVPNGVVDIAVADEAEAVAVAKKYLGYFNGAVRRLDLRRPGADARRRAREPAARVRRARRDQRDRRRRRSVLEIREQFGVGMVTALIRVEGRPIGVIANNPTHLAGAIDADGADKAARFMQLCDAHDIPLLLLCDTPGIMVGPEVEKTALVRHVSRMFVVGASVTVPTMTIVLRKGYGLGAMTMAAGCFKSPLFTVSWPTGEFGGMGLEGAVRLGYRRELEAIEDDAEREPRLQRDGRPHVRTRQGDQRRVVLRDRRRHRPGRLPPLDRRRPRRRLHPQPPNGQETPLHRHLVSPPVCE